MYLDLSAKVPLDLLLPVPVELLLPLLAFQVTDCHKPLTRCLHICRDPSSMGIGTKPLSKKEVNMLALQVAYPHTKIDLYMMILLLPKHMTRKKTYY